MKTSKRFLELVALRKVETGHRHRAASGRGAIDGLRLIEERKVIGKVVVTP